jgi:hypothetical protein
LDSSLIGFFLRFQFVKFSKARGRFATKHGSLVLFCRFLQSDKGVMMKYLQTIIFTSVLAVVGSAQAGYNCHNGFDEETNTLTGDVVVSISYLEKDISKMGTLWSPWVKDDQTFIKYQYWAPAGNDIYLVHFIGINDELDKDGNPTIATLNLFCADDKLDEGGLYGDDGFFGTEGGD